MPDSVLPSPINSDMASQPEQGVQQGLQASALTEQLQIQTLSLLPEIAEGVFSKLPGEDGLWYIKPGSAKNAVADQHQGDSLPAAHRKNIGAIVEAYATSLYNAITPKANDRLDVRIFEGPPKDGQQELLLASKRIEGFVGVEETIASGRKIAVDPVTQEASLDGKPIEGINRNFIVRYLLGDFDVGNLQNMGFVETPTHFEGRSIDLGMGLSNKPEKALAHSSQSGQIPDFMSVVQDPAAPTWLNVWTQPAVNYDDELIEGLKHTFKDNAQEGQNRNRPGNAPAPDDVIYPFPEAMGNAKEVNDTLRHIATMDRKGVDAVVAHYDTMIEGYIAANNLPIQYQKGALIENVLTRADMIREHVLEQDRISLDIPKIKSRAGIDTSDLSSIPRGMRPEGEHLPEFHGMGGGESPAAAQNGVNQPNAPPSINPSDIPQSRLMSALKFALHGATGHSIPIYIEGTEKPQNSAAFGRTLESSGATVSIVAGGAMSNNPREQERITLDVLRDMLGKDCPITADSNNIKQGSGNASAKQTVYTIPLDDLRKAMAASNHPDLKKHYEPLVEILYTHQRVTEKMLDSPDATRRGIILADLLSNGESNGPYIQAEDLHRLTESSVTEHPKLNLNPTQRVIAAFRNPDMATAVERELRDLGFPRVALEGPGSSTIALSGSKDDSGNKQMILITPPNEARIPNPLVLPDVETREVKAGRGTLLVRVMPEVNTRDVTDEHVREVAALVEKSGLKPLVVGGRSDIRKDNVGLYEYTAPDGTKKSVPIVLDWGAVIYADGKQPTEAELNIMQEKWRNMPELEPYRQIEADIRQNRQISNVSPTPKVARAGERMSEEGMPKSSVPEVIEKHGLYPEDMARVLERAAVRQENEPNTAFGDIVREEAKRLDPSRIDGTPRSAPQPTYEITITEQLVEPGTKTLRTPQVAETQILTSEPKPAPADIPLSTSTNTQPTTGEKSGLMPRPESDFHSPGPGQAFALAGIGTRLKDARENGTTPLDATALGLDAAGLLPGKLPNSAGMAGNALGVLSQAQKGYEASDGNISEAAYQGSKAAANTVIATEILAPGATAAQIGQLKDIPSAISNIGPALRNGIASAPETLSAVKTGLTVKNLTDTAKLKDAASGGANFTGKMALANSLITGVSEGADYLTGHKEATSDNLTGSALDTVLNLDPVKAAAGIAGLTTFVGVDTGIQNMSMGSNTVSSVKNETQAIYAQEEKRFQPGAIDPTQIVLRKGETAKPRMADYKNLAAVRHQVAKHIPNGKIDGYDVRHEFDKIDFSDPHNQKAYKGAINAEMVAQENIMKANQSSLPSWMQFQKRGGSMFASAEKDSSTPAGNSKTDRYNNAQSTHRILEACETEFRDFQNRMRTYSEANAQLAVASLMQDSKYTQGMSLIADPDAGQRADNVQGPVLPGSVAARQQIR